MYVKIAYQMEIMYFICWVISICESISLKKRCRRRFLRQVVKSTALEPQTHEFDSISSIRPGLKHRQTKLSIRASDYITKSN